MIMLFQGEVGGVCIYKCFVPRFKSLINEVMWIYTQGKLNVVTIDGGHKDITVIVWRRMNS